MGALGLWSAAMEPSLDQVIFIILSGIVLLTRDLTFLSHHLLRHSPVRATLAALDRETSGFSGGVRHGYGQTHRQIVRTMVFWVKVGHSAVSPL